MNAQRNSAARFHPSRAGFTLVELVVAVSIIVILAGITLRALSMARDSGREYRTKSTISKLDRVIREMYASYRNRRVPIDTSAMNRAQAQQARLHALRDIIRMEMPERFNDITDSPQSIPSRPGLNQAYNALPAPSGENSHAECLYAIVSIGNAERLEDFQASEIGDTDGDGWPEFVDGWGRPIYFLRWAAGFPDSDIQPPPGAGSDHPQFRRDPFDVHQVDSASPLLIPLIFSAGPDGGMDFSRGGLTGHGLNVGQDYHYDGTNYANPTIGTPDGSGTHHDNIHNHRMEQR